MEFDKVSHKIAGGTDRIFCVKCRKLREKGKGNICKHCLE